MQKFIAWVVGIFLGIFPFVFFENYLFPATTSKYIAFSVLIISLLFIIGFWSLFFAPKRRIESRFNLIDLSVSLFFVASWVTAIFGVDFIHSVWSNQSRMQGLALLSLVYGFYVISRFFINIDGWKIVRRLSAVGGVVFALLSYFSLWSKAGYFAYGAESYTIGNSSYAGLYLVIMFFFILNTLADEWKERMIGRRIFDSISLALIFFSPLFFNWEVLVSGSESNIFDLVGSARTSALVLALSIVSIFVLKLVHSRTSKKTRLVFAGSAVAIFFALYAVLLGQFFDDQSKLRQWYDAESTAARPIVWQMAVDVIKERPIIGWGVENFEYGYQKYFDARLAQPDYVGEIWFDRVHNVVLDTLVGGGIVLFVFYLFLFLILPAYLFVRFFGEDGHKYLIPLLLLVHFVELQTSFDVLISTVYIFCVLSLLSSIVDKEKILSIPTFDFQISRDKRVIVGIVLILVSSTLCFVLFKPTSSNKQTFFSSFELEDAVKRNEMLSDGLKFVPYAHDSGRFVMFQVIKDIRENPEILKDKEKVEVLKKEFSTYEETFRRRIEVNPLDFRAKLNLAYVLQYQLVLGQGDVKESLEFAESAVLESPNHPVAPAFVALGKLYSKDLKGSWDYANAYANKYPNVVLPQKVKKHIEDQIRSFPSVEIFPFGNI